MMKEIEKVKEMERLSENKRLGEMERLSEIERLDVVAELKGRKVDEIIVHCTATPEGRGVTVADVDRWHRERGFEGIGYHFLVYLDGTVHRGRALSRVGAHCKGHNSRSIGVCYVGGVAADGRTSKDTRTTAQREALKAIVAEIRRALPGIKVYGHRDFAAKDCPCFNARKEYGNE